MSNNIYDSEYRRFHICFRTLFIRLYSKTTSLISLIEYTLANLQLDVLGRRGQKRLRLLRGGFLGEVESDAVERKVGVSSSVVDADEALESQE